MAAGCRRLSVIEIGRTWQKCRHAMNQENTQEPLSVLLFLIVIDGASPVGREFESLRGFARQLDRSLDTAREKTAPTRDERKTASESTRHPVTPSSRRPLAAYRGAHRELAGKARLRARGCSRVPVQLVATCSRTAVRERSLHRRRRRGPHRPPARCARIWRSMRASMPLMMLIAPVMISQRNGSGGSGGTKRRKSSRCSF